MYVKFELVRWYFLFVWVWKSLWISNI